jgi:hypothetical protein
LLHQERDRLLWPEGAGRVIAQIRDACDTAASKVGGNGFEGGQVSVNIRYDGDANHRIRLCRGEAGQARVDLDEQLQVTLGVGYTIERELGGGACRERGFWQATV